jgi:hypothetical protein
MARLKRQASGVWTRLSVASEQYMNFEEEVYYGSISMESQLMMKKLL